MNSPSSELPEFDNPPLQETILSVEFERLPDWKIPHYGAFWAIIRKDYPRVDGLTPLPSAPANSAVPIGMKLSFGEANLARACFINESRTMQVQVQNDRFLTTWARHSSEDAYPRYTIIRPNFQSQWERFLDFIKCEKLITPQPKRCEVTYVNQIDSGNNWELFQKLEGVFSPWSSKMTDGFLPKPNMVNVVAQYSWPEGEMTIVLQPVIRVLDQTKLVQLILTARLPLLDGANTQSILECFDIGREWIVRGFADITTREMQALWKRKV